MRSRARKAWIARPALDERGFAVPFVLLLLLAVFAVVSVAILASIETQSGSARDQNTKSALAAAEAGVSQALFSYNGGFTTSDPNLCLVPSGGSIATQAADGTGWCAQTADQTVSGTSGLGTYHYQVCPRWSDTSQPGTCSTTGPSAGTIAIVSTGTFHGVQRRVQVVAKSGSGQAIFSDAGVQSQTDISVGSATEILSSTWAGGSISLGPSSKLCGGATVGPTGSFQGGTWYPSYDPSLGAGDAGCSGTPITNRSTVPKNALVLPPVNQGDAATNNDDNRLTNLVAGSGTPADTVSCNNDSGSGCVRRGDISWSPTTRQLSLNGQKTSLTLTGKTYSFCRLTMDSNSTLYVAPNQSVSIFFDAPEACPGLLPYSSSAPSTTAQLYMRSLTRITSSSDPSPRNVAIYFVGSQSIPTGAVYNSNTSSDANCVQNFVMYGPLTQFEFNSNTSYCGAIAGYSLKLDGNNTFTLDAASRQFTLPGTAPHYAATRFVDCSTTTQSAASSGC